MNQAIMDNYGQLSLDTLKVIAKSVGLKSNMQNVIFKPATLEAWVSNATTAKGEDGKAYNQKWFHFDLGRLLKDRN